MAEFTSKLERWHKVFRIIIPNEIIKQEKIRENEIITIIIEKLPEK